MMGPYLPAGVRGLPLQYVLREGWRLQLVLVKGHLVNHHGLRVQTGETNMGVGWTWRLHGTQNGAGNTVTAHVASQKTFCNLLLMVKKNMNLTQTILFTLFTKCTKEILWITSRVLPDTWCIVATVSYCQHNSVLLLLLLPFLLNH